MDSRKSSILKQKVRVPLQEVMLPDFPDDETVTTTVTRSRRVSFGTNLVKEFIVGSAVSTQCVSEYEQAFSSSDSSNTNSSRSATASHLFEQSTFSSRENLRMSSDGHALNLTVNKSHVNTENISVSMKNPSDYEVDKKQLTARSDILRQSKNLTDLHLGPEKVNKHDDSRLGKGKCAKFSSTICFSADSPTADMEFTEGCINLAKSILDKKKKAITVFIQAKSKEEEIEPEGDETYVFESSDAEMSITKCVKADKSLMDLDDFNNSDIEQGNLFSPRKDSDEDDTVENTGEILKKELEIDADTEKSLFSPSRKLSDMFYFPENYSMDCSMDSPSKGESLSVGVKLTNCVVPQVVGPENKVEATLQSSAMDFTKCVRNENFDDSVNMSITENFDELKGDVMEETPCKKIPLDRSHVSFGGDDLSSGGSEDSMELTGCLSVPTNQDVSKLFSLPVEIAEEENKVKIDSLDDSSSGSGKRDSVDSFVGGLFNGNGEKNENFGDMEVDVSFGAENVGLDLTKHSKRDEEVLEEKDVSLEDDEKENVAPEVDFVKENSVNVSDMNMTGVVEEEVKAPEEIIPPPVKEADCSNMDVSISHEVNKAEEMNSTGVVDNQAEESGDEKTLMPDSPKVNGTNIGAEELDLTNKTMNVTNKPSPDKTEGIPFPKESTPLRGTEIRRMNLTGIIPKITPEKIVFSENDENEISRGPCTSLKISMVNDFRKSETPSPSILSMKDLASPTEIVPNLREESVVTENKVDVSGVAAIQSISDSVHEKAEDMTKGGEVEDGEVDVIGEASVVKENVGASLLDEPENPTPEKLPEILAEEKTLKECEPELESSKLSVNEVPEEVNALEDQPENSCEVQNFVLEKSVNKVEKPIDEKLESERMDLDDSFIPEKDLENAKLDLQNELLANVTDMKDNDVSKPEPENLPEISPASNPMDLDDSFTPEKTNPEIKTNNQNVNPDKSTNEPDNNSRSTSININSNTITINTDTPHNDRTAATFTVTPKNMTYTVPNDTFVVGGEKGEKLMESPEPEKGGELTESEKSVELKEFEELEKVNGAERLVEEREPGKSEELQELEKAKELPEPEKLGELLEPEKSMPLPEFEKSMEVCEAEKSVKLLKPENLVELAEPEKSMNLPEFEKSIKLSEPEKSIEFPELGKSMQSISEPAKSPKPESSIKAAVKRPSLEMSPCPNSSQTKKHRLSSDFCESGIRLVTDHSFNEMDSLTLDDMDDEKHTQNISAPSNNTKPEIEIPEPEPEMEIDLTSKSFNSDLNTSGDGKIIETLTEQSKETDCLWKINGFQNSKSETQDLWSFSFAILSSSAVIDFKLKTSTDRDSYSDIIDSQIHLSHDDEYLTSKYFTVTDFGFNKMKKYFEDEKKIETVRHIPYFLDIFNSFTLKLNNYLKQILAILKQYPGSRLINDTLSFRLFSFPVLFSSMITIDLKNLFRLTKNHLSFEAHFGKLNEDKIKEIFEESSKYENLLIDFIISSTKYIIRLELETGRVSKRDHITLLPDYLKL